MNQTQRVTGKATSSWFLNFLPNTDSDLTSYHHHCVFQYQMVSLFVCVIVYEGYKAFLPGRMDFHHISGNLSVRQQQ